MLKTKGSIA
jgi:hypothetical protein